MSKCPVMTAAAGDGIGGSQSRLTADPRGPVLMADYQLMGKMALFNHERVVHTKGVGA